MSEELVYDKAEYHLEGDFPAELEEEQAYVPTGLFVAWLAMNNLLVIEVTLAFQEEIGQLQMRQVSPSHFYQSLGGVLSSEMLTAEGNEFTLAYFDFETGKYLDDYESVLANYLSSLFHVPDTWESYDALAPVLHRRFRQWRSQPRPRAKKRINPRSVHA